MIVILILERPRSVRMAARTQIGRQNSAFFPRAHSRSPEPGDYLTPNAHHPVSVFSPLDENLSKSRIMLSRSSRGFGRLNASTLFFCVLVLWSLLGLSDAHVWRRCPQARNTCFYNYPMTESNGDEYWRTSPCLPRTANGPRGPVATFIAGDEVCIQFYEFVPHKGPYRISLAPQDVQPSDAQTLRHLARRY
jgi:hypothetical protein